MTVLIVEDEPIFRMDLSLRLRRLGFDTIQETAFAEEAVELAEKTDFDLILMDIRLKGAMTGLEAAQKISRMGDTPIVVMSAYQLVEDEIREQIPSLVEFVPKPVADQAIEEAVGHMKRRGD